ncbi:DUF3306 domain-containing protein [Methylobacterium durans]|uniref:DUF3306 domain-containing protein n=1 Tax=Methylobacterium durans TaxID=2202825 RepID=A0A2U8W7E3_9HYPH|nr:DUF3306 domain-containing protein [Methylobacterium durans]AWN42017.1 DUF3306 domain-containing protein [Methylobacterium durans]
MSGGDFLARWSRRKRETQAPPAEAKAGILPDDAAEAPEPGAEAAITEEEIAALPPLDTLTSGTDLTPFLRKGVPALLRNAALRRMWSLDPAIRDYVSEAREYAYDWNVVGGVPGTGPLLPTDDVRAMVGRIFGDAPDDPPEMSGTPETASDAVETASTSPDSVPVAEPEDLPAAEVASSSENQPASLAGHAQAPEPPAEAAAVRQNPQSLTRVRRHGGAIPI